MRNRTILSGNKICFRAGNKEILKNLDINFTKGTVTAIIGPSGSGKTTLMNCLSGTKSVSEGEIYFEGNLAANSHYSNFENIYPKVTAVFQGFTLWPHLSNIENIQLSKYCVSKELIDKYAKLLNVESILSKYPGNCSGGEQQRIALLRHIALNPEVIILDEITSALDVEQIESLSNLLKELKSNGMTIVLITHLLSFAEIVADAFYFIDKGEVCEYGQIEFLKKPRSERLKKFLSYN